MTGASDLAAALRRNMVGATRADPKTRGADWRMATVDTVGSDGTVTTTDAIVARRMETYLDAAPGDLIVVTVSGAGSWLAWGRIGSGTSTAWTPYTPTYVAASGGAALGNGTLEGEYTLRGDQCTIRLSFVAGSTTTFGSGGLRWGLPFTAATLANASMSWIGSGLCSDAGSTYFPGICRILGGTSYLVGISPVTATGGTAVEWRAAVPFTWGSTDYANFGITYKIA